MKVLKTIADWLHKVSNVCVWLSGITLFSMAALIFVDVFARYLFNNSIKGSQEIVEMMIVVVLYTGLAYSTFRRSHVRVDALVNTFPPWIKLTCLGCMTLLCILVSAPIAVQMFRQAGKVTISGNASAILKIPHAPFYYIASFGNALLSLEFLADGLKYFGEAAEARKEKITITDNEKEDA